MNNISDCVTLVKFIYSVGNVNNAVGVVREWVFDSNCEKPLPLIIDSLHLICACSDEEDYFAKLK